MEGLYPGILPSSPCRGQASEVTALARVHSSFSSGAGIPPFQGISSLRAANRTMGLGAPPPQSALSTRS